MAVGVAQHAAEFDCRTCTKKHCDETGEHPGSRGAAGFAVWELGGVGYRTCPLPQITPLSRRFLSLHTHYAKRLMPLTGGLLDQPNAYLRAMEIIEGCMNG